MAIGVWYRRVGGGGIPLLVLHGGPGAGHDYLEPLEGLAPDRAVVVYDQLGCGQSDQPDARSLWRMERFVAEVGTVWRALGLEQIHLLGQSWGGWLAIECMLTHPPGVVRVVLASTSASIPQFVAEAARLKAALPPGVYQTMQHDEASGDLHHPAYEAAVLEFYRRHLCRLDRGRPPSGVPYAIWRGTRSTRRCGARTSLRVWGISKTGIAPIALAKLSCQP